MAVLLCVLQAWSQVAPSDALNRPVSETSNGLTHTYSLDLVGNRLQTVYGGTGRTITSVYDALNRLSTMTESGRVTSYAYDLNGNIVKKTAPNGDTEASAFDALNRATSETAQTGGSVSLFTYTYGYDLVGNVLSVGESYPSGLNNRLVTNTYDAANRLQVEAVTGSAPNVTTTYAYDPANNRTSKTITGGPNAGETDYGYNNLNQLTGYGGSYGAGHSTGTRVVALAYDYDGNRTTRTVSGGSDNGTDTYSYDYENRLVDLVKGTGGGGAGTYAYTYDYRTRRVTRDESSAGGAVTSLVFSGGTSVQEYDNGATTPTVEYIRGSDYGGGVGGILYTLRTVSGTLTPSYTHANKRGDIVAKTSASGTLTYQAQYEAFGKQVATAGSTLDRQKSNSKDTDPTGLVDEGMRYRDLETGMFINRDPAGFVDGPNLYTYVIQNPWTHFDPEGLADNDGPVIDQNQKEQLDEEADSMDAEAREKRGLADKLDKASESADFWLAYDYRDSANALRGEASKLESSARDTRIAADVLSSDKDHYMEKLDSYYGGSAPGDVSYAYAAAFHDDFRMQASRTVAARDLIGSAASLAIQIPLAFATDGGSLAAEGTFGSGLNAYTLNPVGLARTQSILDRAEAAGYQVDRSLSAGQSSEIVGGVPSVSVTPLSSPTVAIEEYLHAGFTQRLINRVGLDQAQTLLADPEFVLQQEVRLKSRLIGAGQGGTLGSAPLNVDLNFLQESRAGYQSALDQGP